MQLAGSKKMVLLYTEPSRNPKWKSRFIGLEREPGQIESSKQECLRIFQLVPAEEAAG
jgi:hypothetical protein